MTSPSPAAPGRRRLPPSWLRAALGFLAPAALAASLAVAQESAAPVLTPAEQALAASRDRLADGDWESALDRLRPHAADPRAAARLFDLGLALLNAGTDPRLPDAARTALLDGAVAAFRALLAAGPEATRARLELARALFLRGRDGPARRHFRRVLAGDVPPPVAANVRRFLAAIESRRRWSAHGGFALAPDTNVGQASEQRVVNAYVPLLGQTVPLTRNNPPPTSGVGLRLFAGGEYRHPLNDRARLRLGAGIARTDHRTRRWDSTALRAHLGPEAALTPRTRASLLLTAARRRDAGETSFDDPGLRLEARHRLSDRTRLSLDLARRERRHAAPGSRDRDGPRTDLALGVTRQATPALDLTGSLSLGRERPREPRARTRTRGLRLGATRDFGQGWTVGLAGSLSRTAWDTRRSTADGARRRDTTTDLTVSVLKRDLALAGFSPRLAVGTARRRSNNRPDDQNYRRAYADVSFVRQF